MGPSVVCPTGPFLCACYHAHTASQRLLPKTEKPDPARKTPHAASQRRSCWHFSPGVTGSPWQEGLLVPENGSKPLTLPLPLAISSHRPMAPHPHKRPPQLHSCRKRLLTEKAAWYGAPEMGYPAPSIGMQAQTCASTTKIWGATPLRLQSPSLSTASQAFF